ncbi:hypothetical protein DPMN_169892 [Dreissena polymorpha]|uniref:Uncharacterized protein n=1 Tax=Dreissena polymorpha TaxID=45954 RepID=A0A9D4DV72_DREPO|nr:hypothetical protein DPMN_169892 [Dreissena polymorpha]
MVKTFSDEKSKTENKLIEKTMKDNLASRKNRPARARTARQRCSTCLTKFSINPPKHFQDMAPDTIAGQTDGRTERRKDGKTDGRMDNAKTISPRLWRG